MKIYSLIPARSNSKAVVSKNIKILKGFPLLAYSIAAAKLIKKVSRVIVSTNSPAIAELAKKYGAEAPFLRPAQFCRDSSNDLDAIGHALRWLEEKEGKAPDLVVYLRPSTPLRDSRLIDKAITSLIKNSKATSLRSAHILAEPPHKMFQLNKAGFFTGFFPDFPKPEYHGIPRQLFPQAYHPNGYVDIVRRDFIEKSRFKLCFGEKILPLITPMVTEIDLLDDFVYLEYQINKFGHPLYDYLAANFPKLKNAGL